MSIPPPAARLGPAASGPDPAPNPAAERHLRRALAGFAILLAGIGGTLLFLHHPEGQFFFPRCTFHATTGWLCPGCGGLRAAHELLHGHFLAAARCNALFVLGTPLALAWWFLQRRRGRPALIGAATVWWLFALSMIFTVVRNLPIAPAAWLVP